MSNLGRFSETLRWTFKHDLALPFPEIILFLTIYIAVSPHIILANSALGRYESLTWDIMYPIIFLIGIGGVRVFSTSLERGELSRQIMATRTSRTGFAIRKFLSFYLSTIVLLVVADVVALVVYMGYFFSPGAYTSIGVAPLLVWGVSLLEQLLLLFFLCALIMFLSLVSRSTTVSLLLFLAITILGISLYNFGVPGWAKDLQLGYGETEIVRQTASYIFNMFYFPTTAAELARLAPDLAVYVGALYRLLGGAILLGCALLRFNSMDLEEAN